MRKPDFCICENKDADQLTAKLISAFVFATQIVQFLYYLNPKFQASSHLLWLYSPVCVGPGRKPRRPVFSQRGSYFTSSMFVYFNQVQIRFCSSNFSEPVAKATQGLSIRGKFVLFPFLGQLLNNYKNQFEYKLKCMLSTRKLCKAF